MTHNIHGIKPKTAVAATSFECERCGEWHTSRNAFSDTCKVAEEVRR